MTNQMQESTSYSDNYEAWRSRVEQELKGKSFEDHLIWKAIDGFSMMSWQYELPKQKVTLPVLAEPWKIVEPVFHTNANEANKAALDALNAGAESIWFQKSFLGAAAEVASNNIDQSIAPVFINGNTHVDIFRAFLKSDDPVSTDAPVAILNGARLREHGANMVTEIALLISMALEAERNGYSANSIIFKTGVGNAFLSEIGKLRGLRWLWASVLKQLNKAESQSPILASNLQMMLAKNDEHSNILRSTSAAMSAIIGGASFVKIIPWDIKWKANHKFSQRISRNVQTLLKEEAHFDKSLNPADGSFFIENLTVELAKKAWTIIQKVEKEGGFIAYARSGALKKLIEADREKTYKAYKENKLTLLGINAFTPSVSVKEDKPESTPYMFLPEPFFVPFELQNSNSI